MYLLGRPPGWRFHRQDLLNRFGSGLTATRTALRELERLGYLQRNGQGRGQDGQFGQSNWSVSEAPVPEWSEDPGQTLRLLTKCGSQPWVDFPTTENPTTENPTSENRTHNNNGNTNNRVNKSADSARTREGKPSRGDAASPARRGEKKKPAETAGRKDEASAVSGGLFRDVNSLTSPSEDDPADVVCHLEGDPVRVAEGDGGQTCIKWRDRAPTYLPPRLGPGRMSATLSVKQARATLRDNPKVAARLARMPDTLGDHPDGGTVQLGISSGGGYVRHKAPSGETLKIEDVNTDTPVLELGLEGALNVLRYGGPTKNDQRVGTDSYGNPTDAASTDAGTGTGTDDVVKTLPDGRRVRRASWQDGFEVEQYGPGSNIWEYEGSLDGLMEDLDEGGEADPGNEDDQA